jgi:hypothetical protein
MPLSTSIRFHRSAILLPALALAACGSASYTRVVSVNPPDATVYINGEKVGQGSARPCKFDFSNVDRIYVQATHPEYQPEMEIFDQARIQQMIAENLPIKLTLRPR